VDAGAKVVSSKWTARYRFCRRRHRSQLDIRGIEGSSTMYTRTRRLVELALRRGGGDVVV
jgi:hypothetical protein